MTACKECRAGSRHAVQGKVRIVWDENGIRRQVAGDIRNIGARGMGFLLPNRIPPHTEVRVECHEQHLLGTAIVRHCSNRGMNFLVGVEFRGTLRWAVPGEVAVQRGWD